MKNNTVPQYDINDNPTHCCPRFIPESWDGKSLHFDNKLFLKVHTRSIFHIPINMGLVFSRMMTAIENEAAMDNDNNIVLSRDLSPWKTEHYVAVTKYVPGYQMVSMSGDFLTKVFAGPYKNAPKWQHAMQAYVRQQGQYSKKVYFFYTSCPKCAKFYGKNYVVAVAQIG